MANPKKGNKKKTADIEKKQIELVLKNADMIKSSISIATHLSDIAGVGPEGVITAMAIVCSDFLSAMSTSLGVDSEQFTDDFFEAIREHMKDNAEEEQKSN